MCIASLVSEYRAIPLAYMYVHVIVLGSREGTTHGSAHSHCCVVDVLIALYIHKNLI